ncbi:hypothetical protein [Sulfurimonas marina]|uniref:Uncharacterized protein n=1 Tax=Sulfurimonas marina TaxID=2590551 RepID=A0A7M3V9N7_9BACT|nr:hypothetical protein [Sulfurimonas marina]QOP40470.1 hypothetical protein FJR03_01425 [Sulfurimonas marina]
MEFFLKHQTVIFRSVGAFLLVMGFALYFWAAPQKVLSENERAAANLARMEASVSGSSSSKASARQQSNASPISAAMQETQKKQIRMLMIMVMIFGAGFLGYSFLKKKE